MIRTINNDKNMNLQLRSVHILDDNGKMASVNAMGVNDANRILNNIDEPSNLNESTDDFEYDDETAINKWLVEVKLKNGTVEKLNIKANSEEEAEKYCKQYMLMMRTTDNNSEWEDAKINNIKKE